MRNYLASLWNKKPKKPAYDEIPLQKYKEIVKHPWALQKIISVSVEQDWEGSHYRGILNTIADDCVGPCPRIISHHPKYEVNDDIEQKWLRYCQLNGVGGSIRLFRRAAAKTGIGIAIPIHSTHPEADKVTLSYKVISSLRLKSPPMSTIEERIFEGIEYNENWEPIKIYLDTGEEYNTNEILLWWKNRDEDILRGAPECGPAMCIFPSVRRYLDALIRSAEFRSSIPMVVKLDPHVWGKDSFPNESGMAPRGKWEIEPGIIPTLPPGASLEGLSHTGTSADDVLSIDMMVGAAARCVNMPLNLATGNSSKHNMASSQVDLGPWKNAVKNDREDFAVVIHRVFTKWLKMGTRIEGYFKADTNKAIRNDEIFYSIGHSDLFSHPDPNKVSSSQYTDLMSGATTLQRIYSNKGYNARRELMGEAELLGVTYEDLCKSIIVGRSKASLQIIHQEEQDDSNEETDKQQSERRTSSK